MSKRNMPRGMLVVSAVCLAIISITWNTVNRFAGEDNISSNEPSSVIAASIPATSLPDSTASTMPTAQATATLEVIDDRAILEGKTPEEIGQFAANSLAPLFLGSTIAPTVLLTRYVTREELPQLGLGCMPDNVSNTEPPYLLVILQGEFSYVGNPPRSSDLLESKYHYAALVVDVWAAAPSVLIGSDDGGAFREILNDPSLPESTTSLPTDCPPRTPGSIPYGAVLPGVVLPTDIPMPTGTVQTTATVPQPVPTSEAP